jgi:hypothetical protein
LSWESVTSTAISTKTSLFRSSPVISQSIQIRLGASLPYGSRVGHRVGLRARSVFSSLVHLAFTNNTLTGGGFGDDPPVSSTLIEHSVPEKRQLTTEATSVRCRLPCDFMPCRIHLCNPRRDRWLLGIPRLRCIQR